MARQPLRFGILEHLTQGGALPFGILLQEGDHQGAALPAIARLRQAAEQRWVALPLYHDGQVVIRGGLVEGA